MTKAIAVCLLPWGIAVAAPSASLFYDHSVPAVSFAATEIHKAYTTRGETLVERGIGGISAGSDTVRLLIAAGRAESARIAGILGVASLKSDKPQSYSIRKSGATLVVLGADATGAMYGGLDLAESVRLGSLADISDTD